MLIYIIKKKRDNITELTSQLLKLINEEKTINEISETMKISRKRIYSILRTISIKGFEFDRKYYSNGDLIDGMYGIYPKIHDNVNDQIEYAIQKYPFDKNILNFVTLGDHDYDAMRRYGQNIARVFENYRHDIIPLGYGFGQINVKNDQILVRHPSIYFEELKLKPRNNYLSLNGHSHKMKISTSINDTTINVPSLSDFTCDTEYQVPSAIRMNLEFKNGIIYNGTFSQLIFSDKGIYRINEYRCHILGHKKDVSGNNGIKLEEDRPKKRILIPRPEIEKTKLAEELNQFDI